MRLTAQKDVVLPGASSPAVDIVEVHEMSMDNVITQMRPADRVPLKRRLGGLHIMMTDRKKQIKAGEHVPLTLSSTAADGAVSMVGVNATAGFAPPA